MVRLILLLLIICTPCYGIEVLENLEEKSTPVLNEILREVHEQTLENKADISTNATNISSVANIIQVVNTQTGASSTGSTTMPDDNSIPQKTEGDEYMTLAITPTSASNYLLIEVVGLFNSTAGTQVCCALFQDSTSNALAAVQENIDNTLSGPVTINFNHYMQAGTTSETTFKVRAGAPDAGTTTFNGTGGSRIFGGVCASSITITEISS